MSLHIHPTSANYPGKLMIQAVQNAFTAPASTHFDKSRMQLCPQHPGVLHLAIVEKIRQKIPQTEFRLHANVLLLNRQIIFDASSPLVDMQAYTQALERANTLLGKPLYSYHAGRRVCCLEEMRDNALRLQDILDCEVAIEGLYPDGKSTWLVANEEEYEWLAHHCLFALDLSHLQIVFAQNKKEVNLAWVKDLMLHPNCREVHISSNDGQKDSHRQIAGNEWWLPLLENCRVPIFSEENLK